MSTRPSKSLVHQRELSEAIQAVINAATPAQRKALAQAMERHRTDFPEDYYSDLGNLLHFMVVDGTHYWPQKSNLRAVGKGKSKAKV
jgi:hypothetical protein